MDCLLVLCHFGTPPSLRIWSRFLLKTGLSLTLLLFIFLKSITPDEVSGERNLEVELPAELLTDGRLINVDFFWRLPLSVCRVLPDIFGETMVEIGEIGWGFLELMLASEPLTPLYLWKPVLGKFKHYFTGFSLSISSISLSLRLFCSLMRLKLSRLFFSVLSRSFTADLSWRSTTTF